ncbi:putative pectinesterase 52 [Morus notabilis]|uniref:putative pectinesterase 52 n=1 Tax=Morus notabilis TaxID=981085 RepID=UPI000CED3BE0|nr:putative pectinesterase 52 [Morus notabilis]
MQFLPPFLFVFILFNIANSSVAFRNININADRRGRSENVNNSDVASAIITVDQNGSGKFKTIQAAIDSIPSGNHDWIKIKISRGIYTHVKQALAARIYGDKSAFIECGFIGFQDTLWDATGRHYFSNCYFEGAIDFIFGFAQSYYENSLINVTVGTRPPTEIAVGFITAQGRASANDPGGFVFEGGSVSGSGRVLLGRAYGAYSRVIFHGTDLGQVVAPQGWDAWSYKGQESTLTYAEIECKGAGLNISERVAWEKKPGDIQQILQEYSRSSFIDQDGWIDKLPR